MSNFGFLDLSTLDLIIILIIVLLFFGSTRLPKLTRSLGESFGEFRKGLSSSRSDKSKPGNNSDQTVNNRENP